MARPRPKGPLSRVRERDRVRVATGGRTDDQRMARRLDGICFRDPTLD